MQQYIGTKAILARPMTRGEYNLYQNWTIPPNENPKDEGYLVEYIGGASEGGRKNHPNHEGYISWSPKGVFERSYRANGQLTFGDAILALKNNQKVARAGWNGKGMWLAMSGSLGGRSIEAGQFWSPHNRAYAESVGGKATVLPCITMKTADGAILMGWLASQSDMLAEDWSVVE